MILQSGQDLVVQLICVPDGIGWGGSPGLKLQLRWLVSPGMARPTSLHMASLSNRVDELFMMSWGSHEYHCNTKPGSLVHAALLLSHSLGQSKSQGQAKLK